MKRLTFRYVIVFILSAFGLLWERLWKRLWAVVTLALFFVALSLFNLPVLFGITWHLIILGVFTVAIAVALLRTNAPFSIPMPGEVERHMEKVSALRHRPLETLGDRPVENLSEEALSLWHKHLQKTALYIHSLRVYLPQPDISSRDRWALRYMAVIFMTVGLVIAQGDAGPRIRQALAPDIGSLFDKNTAALDIWITPPEYTHEATVFLASSKRGARPQNGALQVPAGSVLKLRLAGYRYAPRLQYAGESHALTQAKPRNFTFEMPLQQSGNLSLNSWLHRLGQWQVTVLPDTAPEISILQIGTTPRSAVKITYNAADDHGIAKLAGIIGPAPDTDDRSGNSIPRFDIPPPPASGDTVHTEDLTAHPWAGLPVTLTLEAEDSLGHKSTSSPASFVLPERDFTNPIAQRIISERKKLLRSKNVLVARAVAENLADIAGNPALYKDDIVTFLSLSMSVNRLIYDGSDTAVSSVAELLWDVALKLEDGGLSLAQRELRDALQKLSQALNDKNTSKQQLQEILDDVQQKMQQYIQTLAQELQQRLQQGKKMPILSPELAQKFMKNIDINKILEQMRQMSQANSREDMQKMADNLRNAIDNLDMKKMDEMREKQMQAMEALQSLEEIIHRQQSLFDKTNKTGDPADMPELKQEQSALREKLGEALHKLGEGTGSIPENFARADQSMKQSGAALGKGKAKDSLPHQKNALDELQKGLDDAVRQMAEAMQNSIMSFGMMPDMGNFGENFDPFGRNNGRIGGEDVKIPTEKEQRRVQEIIEELRHRSNEPNRTKVERDYIDRLLDQF